MCLLYERLLLTNIILHDSLKIDKDMQVRRIHVGGKPPISITSPCTYAGEIAAQLGALQVFLPRESTVHKLFKISIAKK